MRNRLKIKNLVSVVLAMVFIASVFAPITGAVAQTTKGRVTVHSLVLREQPSTSSGGIRNMPQDTIIEILGTSGDWYKVRYGNFTGYAKAEYITTKNVTGELSNPDGSTNQSAQSDGENTAEPASNTSFRQGDKGDNIKQMQNMLVTLGYLDSADGDFGPKTTYAVKKFQSDKKLTTDGIVGAETLEEMVKALESLSADDDTLLKEGDKGDAVKSIQALLNEKGYNIIADGHFGPKTTQAVKNFQKANNLNVDGVVGAGTIKALRTAGSAGASVNSAGSITLASSETMRLGDTGDKVKAMQNLLVNMKYLKNADGIFGLGTHVAVKLFQSRNGLSSDGVVGAKTLEKLGSSSAVPYKVEKLDWWNDVRYIFRVGMIAAVTDVKTGVTIQVKRRVSTNHADVEPINSEDAAKLKKLFGENGSWDRRAVVVTVGKYAIAASMNGMPHGESSISFNDYDGHICIHFYNSRTHATNNVDASHQAMVEAAMRY